MTFNKIIRCINFTIMKQIKIRDKNYICFFIAVVVIKKTRYIFVCKNIIKTKKCKN